MRQPVFRPARRLVATDTAGGDSGAKRCEIIPLPHSSPILANSADSWSNSQSRIASSQPSTTCGASSAWRLLRRQACGRVELAGPKPDPLPFGRCLLLLIAAVAHGIAGRHHLAPDVSPVGLAGAEIAAIFVASMQATQRRAARAPLPSTACARPPHSPTPLHRVCRSGRSRAHRCLRGVCAGRQGAGCRHRSPSQTPRVRLSRSALAAAVARRHRRRRRAAGKMTQPPMVPMCPAGAPFPPPPVNRYLDLPDLNLSASPCFSVSQGDRQTRSRHNGCRILHLRQQLLKDCCLDCNQPVTFAYMSMSIAVSTSTDKIIVDKSRSHRNKAVSKTVRATRERLQTGSSAPSGFEREMLNLYIGSALHGAHRHAAAGRAHHCGRHLPFRQSEHRRLGRDDALDSRRHRLPGAKGAQGGHRRR